MVTLTAKIVHTGKTSMHIYIRVMAGDPKQNKMIETGHCIMAFVASDEEGCPVEVPTWKPQSKQDFALEKYAIQAKESAQSLDKELLIALSDED
jgi:acyl-CoA hydrolase